MKIRSIRTGSSPLIVHGPGWTFSRLTNTPHEKLSPLWPCMLRAWHKRKKVFSSSGNEHTSELTILTCSSSDEKTILEQSLACLGLSAIVLRPPERTWRNIDRFEMYEKILPEIKSPYLMVLDAYDAMVLRNPIEAVDKFKKMNCDMLFNGQVTFYPNCGENYRTEVWKTFERKIAPGNWPYLNAGAFIVKTSFFEKFLGECAYRSVQKLVDANELPLHKDFIYEPILDSDQLVCHWIYCDWYPKIKVDDHSEIFMNLLRIPRSPTYVALPGIAYTVSPVTRALFLAGKSVKKSVRTILSKGNQWVPR